jgi:hypothetical protein
MLRASVLVSALSMLMAAGAQAQCPPAPTNVSTSASACSQVITWSSATSPLLFHILRSTTGNVADATQIGFAGGAARTYTDTTVAPDVTYRYWVRAVAANTGSCPTGQSAPAGPAIGLIATPPAPASLTTTNTCDVLKFEWPAVAGATKYHVILDTPDGPAINDRTVTTPSIDLTAYVTDGPTRIRVYSQNDCAESAASATAIFTPYYPVGYVENATIAIGSTCGIALNWTRTPGFDYGVTLRRKVNTTTAFQSQTYVPPGVTSFVDQHAVPGVEYKYTIVPNRPCRDVFNTEIGGPVLYGMLSALPSIGSPPSQRPALGSTTTLSIPTPPTTPGVEFSWWKTGPDGSSRIRLSDSPRITGTATPTMTIRGITPDDNGVYIGIANVGCASPEVGITLIVNEACKADYNGDGVRSIDDVFIYINAWFAECP